VKKYLFIILLLYFSPLNAWESLSDFPGPDRLNPKILSMNGKIFIFGGQNNIYPNSPIYDVWVYHIDNDTWEEKNSLPLGIQHSWNENSADFSIAQNIIYSMYKNRLYKYSMADDNWELINSAFPGSSDNSPFSFSDGQYIYAGFGEWYQDGYYGGYWYKDEDIFRYDINNSVWSFFDRWDQFYDRPQVSIHNENVFIFNNSYNANDTYGIYNYNISNNSFDPISYIPTDLIDLYEDDYPYFGYYVEKLSFIAFNGELHFFGGYDVDNSQQQFHDSRIYKNDYLKYSINDNTWLYEEAVIPTSNSDFPGRANPSLTTIGSNLYLGFGTGSFFENLTPDGNYAHNDMWVLNMIISGDLNGDNIINILDIVELVNVILQNEMEYIEIADINSDSVINIFDLIHLIDSI